MIFNNDQLAVNDLAGRFAREKLAPEYQVRGKTGVLDGSVIREMGELGLMGADLPEGFRRSRSAGHHRGHNRGRALV